MHPFTSLTLWALAACTTLILPTQTILPVYSAATFFCLIALKATRRRAKYVVWLMFSLGAGLWLVHGGWLTEWLSGTPRSPERWAHAITLWLRILAIVSTSQLWMQYVPVQRFIRALFASRLPPGVAYLFAGPLLVVEQLKRQLAIIHEAQRARGVPLDEWAKTDERFRFDRDALQKESIGGGWVTFSGKFCTEYGIATTAARMAYAVLHDEKVILPASTELCGEYGEEGLFAGVPCVIGENGVEQVVELPLTADEKATFHACCEGIRHNMEHLKEI